MMNIAHIEEQSFIYGPGCRFVIWVQGCSIHCKGCWNKNMWSFKPQNLVSVTELINKIKQESDLIEGITLLGGEPLDQLEEVLQLLVECGKMNLSTMLFTGYEINEIYDKGFSSILDSCDILITGRYVESKRTLNHQWIGSTNQEIRFISDRYKSFVQNNSNYVEVTIDETGRTTLLGFPNEDIMNDILTIHHPR
ncbi:MAG: 4Fe-4S single cluster domain-containing protein [Bacteroidia bacterium]